MTRTIIAMALLPSLAYAHSASSWLGYAPTPTHFSSTLSAGRALPKAGTTITMPERFAHETALGLGLWHLHGPAEQMKGQKQSWKLALKGEAQSSRIARRESGYQPLRKDWWAR